MEQLNSVPLNQGQKDAADGFFEFLFGKQKELIISGGGGNGKTYLMSHLIDEVMPQYLSTCKMMGIPPEYSDVQMTATSNSAAEVLAKATGRPTETIHSFMNLKVIDDHSTGRSLLTKGSGWKVYQNMIIFIDECSYIDTSLRTHITDGTQNCKIIYVGDHCQLAPVMEPISPIYLDDLPFFELTEPMRTKDPFLQALNLQLRHTVETGEFLPIQIVPGVIDWLDDDMMELAVNTQFTQQTQDARILSYTNTRVVEYNEHIRTIRKLPHSFGKGEFLVSNTALRLNSLMLKIEEEVEIIEESPLTEMADVTSDIQLEFRRTTLQNRYGTQYRDVMVPVDREYFTKLIKWFQKQKLWNRYFFLKNNFPDLRQRDAATVHKAQGSSYDTVFIDLGNLSTCHNSNQAARLLYVACSRARSRIIFYGQLAQKYGGLIQ